MLFFVIIDEALLRLRTLFVAQMHLGPKVLEHVGQGLSVHDGKERDGHRDEC